MRLRMVRNAESGFILLNNSNRLGSAALLLFAQNLESVYGLIMKLILFIYLKTTSMKMKWKKILAYIIRIVELLITGAAGGAMMNG